MLGRSAVNFFGRRFCLIKTRRFHTVSAYSKERFIPESDCLKLRSEDDFNGSIFHYAWLRDNCTCWRCVDKSTKQKLFSSAEVPHDITPIHYSIIEDDQGKKHLEIAWNNEKSEPHRSTFSLDWLKSQKTMQRGIYSNIRHPILTLWDGCDLREESITLEYEEFGKSDSGHWDFLQNMQKYGLTIVRNVPTDEKEIEKLANRIGNIRTTFYGRTWDVKSVINAKNIAYTPHFLDLHMDLMYFESPPGVQMLHCLKNTVVGGNSIFSDSFKAVEILKSDYPEEFDILSKVPVTFHYDNDGHIMKYRRPTIEADGLNDHYRIFYSPPFQAPLEAPENLVVPFYKAFNRFSQILHRKEALFTKRLAPGDCAIFDNRRVLHGRTDFDATSGSRHFKGTYVDWDDLIDSYNSMKKKHSMVQ